MTDVQRTAGVAGSFPVTFSQVPVEPPVLTIYSDAARTQVAAPPSALVATANPAVWTANYPADLTAGRYYLAMSVVLTVGQPAYIDQDDTLLLAAVDASVAGSLVTLAQVKRNLGLDTTDRHDDELLLLIDSATSVIEGITGAVLFRTVTEVVHGNLTRVWPVVSVDSVTVNGVVQTGTYSVANGSVLRYVPVGATVTYTAGQWSTVPANVQRAALRWIAWSWRRDHGGSDTFMPGGEDASIPGPGVRGIEAELRHILALNGTGVA